MDEVIHNRVKYDFESWISVKDKLPQESGAYLVSRYIDDPIIDISQYTAHLTQAGFSEDNDKKITHWMKLPDPPKEQ